MKMFDGRALLRTAPTLVATEYEDFFSTGGRELAAIACERARQAIDELEDEWVRCDLNLTLPIHERVRVLDQAARKAEIRLLTVARFRDILARELREAWKLYEPTPGDPSADGVGSSNLPKDPFTILNVYRDCIASGAWLTCNAIESEFAARAQVDSAFSAELGKLRRLRLRREAPAAADAIACASENLAIVDAVLSAASDFIAEARRRIDAGGSSLLPACALDDMLAGRIFSEAD